MRYRHNITYIYQGSLIGLGDLVKLVKIEKETVMSFGSEPSCFWVCNGCPLDPCVFWVGKNVKSISFPPHPYTSCGDKAVWEKVFGEVTK